MRELGRSAYFLVVYDSRTRVARMTRLPPKFATVAEVETAFDHVVECLARLDRAQCSILIDLRAGPMRNDPVFEQTLERQRKRVTQGFRRVAMLVATVTGAAQVERHARADAIGYQVFSDEAEALRYVSGQS
jgi:hypothetical protein